MSDRQLFESRTLPNGIRIHSHRMDVPFFSIHIIMPVGSVHSHAANRGGMPGIAHFMEHALFNRSEKYPEKDSFNKLLSLKGGYWNAVTHPYTTDVWIDAPCDVLDLALEGLLDHLFRPLVLEEDLAIERNIVRNERNGRRFYPSGSESGQYLDTEWMNSRYFPIEQLFGTDDDLDRMTPELVRAFQHNYYSDEMQVLVGGGHDLPSIVARFEELAVGPIALVSNVEPASWKDRSYRERAFNDVSTPTHYLGQVVPRFDFEDSFALQFAMRLLANSVHGPLYEWTRKEKGWTYGMSYGGSSDRDRIEGWLRIPLNDKTPVDEIRGEIHERMRRALRDGELVRREIDRRKHQALFFYQTLDDRMGAAFDSLNLTGSIKTEAEHMAMLDSIADIRLMRKISEEYLAPEVTGELLVLPN